MNKTVLITGCSSGLGLSTTNYLRDKGFIVIPTVRKESDLKLLPGSVLLDVTWSQEKIDKVIKEIALKYGAIDCLINNAGYGYQGLIEKADETAVRNQFETNFIGVFKMIKSFLPIMKKRKSGMIINISSILGLISIPEYGIYSASKFALEAMSKALRMEVEKDNIKVVVVNPGGFKTDFNKKSIYNYEIDFTPKGYGLLPIEFSKLIEKILLTDKPKNNYIIGKESLSVRLIRALPDFLTDPIMKKYFS
jgi:short-subunit dehydrogenase